ncbi:MAG TPA: TPM domain-containing protein [Bacteroidales bacterium]|nr:TPM domain-containing protein [Bacteroidales bacterium]
MKKNLLLAFVVLFLQFILFNADGIAQIPAMPEPPRLVNDFTGTLSEEEIYALEQKLINYNDTTSTQILVVLVNELGGYDPADFAFRLGQQWGVGQQQHNNGAVILIKPKTKSSRGQAFIATGYGLEAVIPDALARRIVNNEMIPEFKNDRYFDGIWRATDVMFGLASGEFTADDYDQSPDAAWFVPILVFLIIF